jgi:hypothetical protein
MTEENTTPEAAPDAQPEIAEGAIEEAVGNAWESAMGELGDDWLTEATPVEGAPAEAAEPTPEPTATDDGEGEPTVDDGPTQAAPQHFAFEGGAVDWGDGTAVTFKADRENVSVGSLDELVQLAQKGHRYDRGMNDLAVQRQAFDIQVLNLKGKVDESEEILAKVLWDEEFAEQLREKGEIFRTSEGRDALRAQRELEDRKAQDTQVVQAQQTQQAQNYWGAVKNVADAMVENSDYPNLDERHADVIVGQLARNYASIRQNLVTRITAQAKETGVDAEKAEQAADALASRYLTEESLKGVAKMLNDQLVPADSAPTLEPEGEPMGLEAEAAARNEALERKRDRANVARAAVSGQGVPAGTGAAAVNVPNLPEGEGNAFQRRMEQMRTTLLGPGE